VIDVAPHAGFLGGIFCLCSLCGCRRLGIQLCANLNLGRGLLGRLCYYKSAEREHHRSFFILILPLKKIHNS